MNATPTTDPIEIIPGQLYLLGDCVRVDERLSWRSPASHGMLESINAYVRIGDSGAFMVDTGVPLHWPVMSAQMDVLASCGTSVRLVMATRNEPDCIANMGNVVRKVSPDFVGGPGLADALDFFHDIATAHQFRHFGAHYNRVTTGRCELDVDVVLDVWSPALKTLATNWLYDQKHQILFCSDSFSEGLCADGATRTIGQPGDFGQICSDMAEHLLTKFDWLERANTGFVADQTREFLEGRPVRILAPSRGAVIVGEEPVRQRLKALDRVLRELPSFMKDAAHV